MNMTLLIIISIILLVIALIWTLIIFKREENKMKQYEREGDTSEDELRRSKEYESRSLKADIPLQIIIYTVFTVLFFVGFLLYLM